MRVYGAGEIPKSDTRHDQMNHAVTAVRKCLVPDAEKFYEDGDASNHEQIDEKCRDTSASNGCRCSQLLRLEIRALHLLALKVVATITPLTL